METPTEERRSYKGRSYSNVPVNFVVSLGPRFLADEEKSRKGSSSLHVDMASAVTMHPDTSTLSNSLGTEVISLLFSSHMSVARVKPPSRE